jgi:chaperonin GroEL (HSP60 family)
MRPFGQILLNAGIMDAEDKWNFHPEKAEGYDSKTKKKVNMFDAGIVDSFDVVMEAVRNAIGVASGILTCGTVVLLPRNENSIDEAIKNAMQTPQ